MRKPLRDRNSARDRMSAAPARRRRKEARPAEIVEAGLAEFIQHGFARTRLEDVARRAGVSKGTIYLYFEDKQALFLAAIRSRVQPLFGELDAVIDAYPGSTVDLLSTMLSSLHERLVGSDAKYLMRIVISEGASFPELTEHYYRETASKGRALIRRIVARGVARGELRDGPASAVPEVVMGPALMAAIWTMTFQSFEPLDARRFAEAHIDLVLNGLARRRR